VEYKGHRLLDSAKQADVGHVKKQVSSDLVNFKHPFTSETALVCFNSKLFIIFCAVILRRLLSVVSMNDDLNAFCCCVCSTVLFHHSSRNVNRFLSC